MPVMPRTLLLALALAACSGVQETRHYAGPQTPTAGTCDPPSRATLTRRGNTIILAPAQGTLALTGEIHGTDLSAQTTLTGADKKPYSLIFTGHVTGPAIAGTLVTPRCRYTLALKLTGD